MSLAASWLHVAVQLLPSAEAHMEVPQFSSTSPVWRIAMSAQFSPVPRESLMDVHCTCIALLGPAAARNTRMQLCGC